VTQRVVVVGGGIAGLAAAHRLRELGPDLEIVVLDQGDRLGGKIHTVPFRDRAIEAGAETFLMRDAGAPSAALALANRVGLADALVHPAPVPAALAIDGELRTIPGATLMGIPADPTAVASIATAIDNDDDRGAPIADGDVAVGALVRDRLGDAVVDRLVDPLLGGVYAGRADALSLQATVPGLYGAAQQAHTLRQAVQDAMQAAPRPAGTPVFATVHGGLTRLVDAVAAASRARLQLGETVRGIARTANRWQVNDVDADAVVVAVPAAPAARILQTDAIAELEYASVVLVTLALPPGTRLPELSGFLAPAGQGYAVKAATFFTTKWPHLSDGPVLVRASLGRYGETDVLQRPDEALVELVRDELPPLLGTKLPEPVAARVTRWGGGLPQYGVGHVTRIQTVRAALPQTLALAGAAFDGVGIAACVRSGEAAAERVWAALGG
jgi:oxygen-dependent protoporphyrinogen oxidase